MTETPDASELDWDPRTEGEWDALRQAGYRVVDAVLQRHRTLRDAPAWQPVPQAVRDGLSEEPSRSGVPVDAAVDRALRLIEPHGTGNLSPRFWGWVLGGGNLPGVLGQLIASGMNANSFAGNQGPVFLERQVLAWFESWFGFPHGASALLLDGGSMANILGLAIARHRATGGEVKTSGGQVCGPLRLYASKATHNSILKGAQFLGLGSRAVRWIDTQPDDAIDMEALERALDEDERAGLKPFCLVGSAGTVGTGAIDPLDDMHELARNRGLWLHVDGAIGALGWLSPKLRGRLRGLDRADSLAFDLHKWGQVPYDAGCLLVRDGNLHREAFEVTAGYLATLPGGLPAHGSPAFNALSPLLSRGDRALKIWMTFMTLGMDRVVSFFERSADQAEYLAGLISGRPELELLANPRLNIVCFRYRGRRLPETSLDALNERIMVLLQETGFCVMSPYRVEGRFTLRVCLSNHRTRRADLDALVERVISTGAHASSSPT